MSIVRATFNGFRSKPTTNLLIALSLWAYYEADAEPGANDALVTSWSDLSGNGRHMTQGGATSIQKKIDSGVHSFYFNNGGLGGSARYVRLPSMAGLTSAEIFVVCKAVNTGSSQGGNRLLGLGSGDADSYFPFNDDGKYYVGTFSTTRKNAITVAAQNVIHCLNIESATNSWKMRQDGVEKFSTGTNTFEAPTLGCIGVTNNASITAFGYYGRIYAIYIAGGILTTPNRDILETYISSKYGIIFS